MSLFKGLAKVGIINKIVNEAKKPENQAKAKSAANQLKAKYDERSAKKKGY